MYDLFINAYTITSLVMFPILVFIVILLIRDLGKYSKMSESIKMKVLDITDEINETGFKKNHRENDFDYIERYVESKKKN